jgi:hypothetical protein
VASKKKGGDGQSPANPGRFEKGKSGNPKGRPKKPTLPPAPMSDALSAKVSVTDNGRKRTITKADVLAIRMANLGAGGDIRATRLAFDISEKERKAAPAPVEAVLDPAEERVFKTLVQRIRNAIKDESNAD